MLKPTSEESVIGILMRHRARAAGEMKVNGRCHGARIVYEADVEPGIVAICNCADRQTLSGFAFRMI